MAELSDKKKSELIDRGAKLDRRIKKANAELNTIKGEVKKWESGTYGTPSGSIVAITTADSYTDPDPSEIYKWFKKNLSVKVFLKCVKIQVTETKKIMGEGIFAKYRMQKKDSTVRISFKTVTTVELGAMKAGSNVPANGNTRLLKI